MIDFVHSPRCQVDFQAELQGIITPEEMEKLVLACWQMQVPDTSHLFTLQLLYELRCTHQTGCRHERLRDELWCHFFTR